MQSNGPHFVHARCKFSHAAKLLVPQMKNSTKLLHLVSRWDQHTTVLDVSNPHMTGGCAFAHEGTLNLKPEFTGDSSGEDPNFKGSSRPEASVSTTLGINGLPADIVKRLEDLVASVRSLGEQLREAQDDWLSAQADGLAAAAGRLHQAVRPAAERLQQALGQDCTPPVFTPPTDVSASISGPGLSYTLTTGGCQLRHDSEAVQRDLIMRCTDPGVALSRTAARYTSAYRAPASFVASECTTTFEFGPAATVTVDLWQQGERPRDVMARWRQRRDSLQQRLQQRFGKDELAKAEEGLGSVSGNGGGDGCGEGDGGSSHGGGSEGSNGGASSGDDGDKTDGSGSGGRDGKGGDDNLTTISQMYAIPVKVLHAALSRHGDVIRQALQGINGPWHIQDGTGDEGGSSSSSSNVFRGSGGGDSDSSSANNTSSSTSTTSNTPNNTSSTSSTTSSASNTRVDGIGSGAGALVVAVAALLEDVGLPAAAKSLTGQLPLLLQRPPSQMSQKWQKQQQPTTPTYLEEQQHSDDNKHDPTDSNELSEVAFRAHEGDSGARASKGGRGGGAEAEGTHNGQSSAKALLGREWVSTGDIASPNWDISQLFERVGQGGFVALRAQKDGALMRTVVTGTASRGRESYQDGGGGGGDRPEHLVAGQWESADPLSAAVENGSSNGGGVKGGNVEEAEQAGAQYQQRQEVQSARRNTLLSNFGRHEDSAVLKGIAEEVQRLLQMV